jgi:UrcA family protein
MKTLTLAAVGALALAIATPSLAETVILPDGRVAYTDDEIVVTPPYVVSRERGRGPYGRTDAVRVSRVVSARDLDLRYAASVDELHRRVIETAQVACEQAEDALRGDTTTSDRECVRAAVRGAMPQFRAVVSNARYTRY